MSYISDWKCGALSDDEYRAACQAEVLADIAAMAKMEAEYARCEEENSGYYTGEGPVEFEITYLEGEKFAVAIHTDDTRGAKYNTQCTMEGTMAEIFYISDKMKEKGLKATFDIQ